MKNKKGGFLSRSFIRKIINLALVSALSIICWEIGQKEYDYIKSNMAYSSLEREMQSNKDMQTFLETHSFDWITVTNTAINYPIMQSTDNSYYLNHNYKDEKNTAGSIFYDAYDEPFNETVTMVYGHSMKNGSMFNNLHYFQKDHKRFEKSKLIIETKEGSKTYVPLGYYVTNHNFFYHELDALTTEDALKLIEQNADYFIRNEHKPDAHIIGLYTCDYSIDNGKLIVFYIEEE